MNDDDEEAFRRYDDSARRQDRWADMKIQQLRRLATFTSVKYTDRQLLRHTVILGGSGSGKTNHAFHVIKEANPTSCIIVDVKREYRELRRFLDREVKVLSIGDEPVFKFNPLSPAAGVKPLLWDRAFADIFTRAYGLAEPSRRILLDSLALLRSEGRQPTLRELEKAVARFEAGSNKEQASRRSLESRLHINNSGPVGASLNAEDQLDVDALDETVAVFEMERVDSLRDQRFLAELILGYLWHRDKVIGDNGQPDETLKRLVVIEEAHRYLSEERAPEQRGNRTLLELAVAEARRYGWGFLIIDQMPTLLSRYVWDNAGTVMTHRLANLDSYEVVKGALGPHPIDRSQDDEKDPIALRLPEDIVLFRRYVDPKIGGAGVGVTKIPRVLPKGTA